LRVINLLVVPPWLDVRLMVVTVVGIVTVRPAFHAPRVSAVTTAMIDPLAVRVTVAEGPDVPAKVHLELDTV
jgi:hypothetical protein